MGDLSKARAERVIKATTGPGPRGGPFRASAGLRREVAAGLDDLFRSRALAAYFRHNPHGYILDQPSGAELAEVDGHEYVKLYNVNGVLAVYRVRPSGALKRLVRWPKEVGANFE